MNTSNRLTEFTGKTRVVFALALAAVICFLAAPTVYAATGQKLEWGTMGITLFGGLAIFLYGMEQMAVSLKAVAGDRMKLILAKLTTNRIMGLLTGAFVTAVIQSSSVTTVMLVGFVSANLMSLSQAVGVILGADIGTTITAQIVAFKVTKYALLLVGIGFLFIFTGRSERIKQYGQLIMGLGMIFFGMAVMSDGMKPLRDYEPFLQLMQEVKNPLVGILIGAFFTALIQSSSATMGVIIALALQGLIPLEAGIALALGANIGTCVTAGLAAIGKPREAVRVAVAHVTFKIAGVFLIIWWIPAFADIVRAVSPAAPEELTGMDQLAWEAPRQIANAHTLFNVAIAFLFLPFAGWFARFCEWVVPDKALEEEIIGKPKYLDDAFLDTPSFALDRVRLEYGRMGRRAMEMLQRIMPAVLVGDKETLEDIRRYDDEVDSLHGAIVTYLGNISRKSLTEKQTDELLRLMDAVNDLENIGDIIETDLVHLGKERIEAGFQVSEATREILVRLHGVVSQTVDTALDAVRDQDEQGAIEVIGLKGDINRLVDSAAMHEAQRLVAEEPNRLAAYATEMDVIEKLKRIYYFAKRMAKTVLSAEAAKGADE